MRAIKYAVVMLFVLMIVVPVVTMNMAPDSISKIDNRALAKFPFGEDAPNGDLTKNIENYVQDRIGFRDKMILAFTMLNDNLFGKMVHPTYCYGKDGYIFFKMGANIQYGEFHEAFADMVKKIQTYCEERDIPFLFAFDPSKTSVLTQYLPRGVNYDNRWVNTFLQALDKRDINYVDNTGLLIQKSLDGEATFNQKYDAGHWNDLGAFYGVNNMLSALHDKVNAIHINRIDEFTISKRLETSLPVSVFPIHEYVPSFSFKNISEENKTKAYIDEVERNPRYRGFSYFVNKERRKQGSPKVLVFQGSYMNGKGNKYLRNSLGEYIAVHNYQNVINFPYYFNIFKPDCVLFEVTEYTINNGYFDLKRMKSMNLNPPLKSMLSDNATPIKHQKVDMSEIKVEKGKMLTKITWTGNAKIEYAWLLLEDNEFDMIQSTQNADAYYVTVLTSTYNEAQQNLKIATAWADGHVTLYE